MRSFGIGFVIGILALIILLANSLYIVTDKQTAILLRFGEIIDPKIESGLHFKVPILNTVRKFDSRVLTLDAIPQPYFTEEKKRLIVDAFVANAELGVEVIDVRVKKIELPSEVNDSVYNRMRTERERLAQELRAEGNEIAEEIRANADKERTVILADAYKTAEIIKGEGDAAATSTYAKAFNKNPEFYEFTRSLSAYQSTFENKSDVLLIDPESDFFKYLDSSFGTSKSE